MWKMPDGWSGPGNGDQNKRATNVPDGLPYREGQSKTVTACSCTVVTTCVMKRQITVPVIGYIFR